MVSDAIRTVKYVSLTASLAHIPSTLSNIIFVFLLIMESLYQQHELYSTCQGRDRYFFPDRLLYSTYRHRPLQFGHVLSHAALMDYIFDLVEYLDDLMCVAYVVCYICSSTCIVWSQHRTHCVMVEIAS
jgi:hypothetical protein